MKPSPSFLKVLLLLAIFSLVPGTLIFIYYRTGGPASQKELLLQKNLRYALMAGTTTVDLTALTPWPWVRVCALTSKLTSAEVADVIGFPYRAFGQLYWMHRPEFWTLLFIDSPREANWGSVTPVVPVRIPRQQLAELALPQGVKGLCLDRADGRLPIVRRPGAPVGTSPVTIQFGKQP